MNAFWRWFPAKWRPRDPGLMRAYQVTFSTADGQLVLQDLLDGVYCTVYEGTDPQAAVILNARRALVQEILMNIDHGEHPEKYQARPVSPQTQEAPYVG